MADVFDETIRRQNRLLQLGYEVKTIWEHDYCKLKETDEMKHFLDTNGIITNLEQRDVFFGARVNGFKLFRDAQQDETIEYVDFTSLYPYCVVQNSSVCTHSENERAFWCTFTTVEVLKAIEKGYKIIEIFEIWHFENTSSDLFSDYVNYFLRIKQESSEFLSRIQTPEDRQKYVADYYENERILLRHDKIDYNPGLRALAKLCFNSLWGKFCQKDNRLNTEFINDPPHFYRRLNGADIEMHDLCILNDDLVEIVFKRKHEYEVENKLTNIFIGIFTTAWARLELYNVMDLLQESLLYVDTDSCIYVNKPGGPRPLLEDYLGHLTNEITQEHGLDPPLVLVYKDVVKDGNDGDMIFENEENASDISLLETDDEEDMDFESENEYDKTFINDIEMSEDENNVSFYRRFNSNY
ncbi:uncharacterized protein LOC124447417 [Xenia sp. Carnegie-2017]|uniref:uncharacterized protein LOC124447417 n=1 Tax=Xenia sp. Carnegie-2017 TaxID=2897299 RepID=UPI001F0421D3|nr:uncharacterized protein LOC124447417 [Xenia sp. Carnegie-2017]